MTNKFDEIVHGREGEEEKKEERIKKSSIKKHDDVKEIHIRIRIPQPIIIERIIYGLVIIILLFFVFRSPFCKVDISKNVTPENMANEEKVIVNKPQETKAEPTATPAPQGTTVQLPINASLSFSSSDIILGNVSKNYKVNQINFKIINNGGVLRGRIAIYWYDEADSDAIKAKVRASKSIIVPAGQTLPLSATDFSGSYLNSENPEETFVLELTDSEGKIIDKKEIVITP